MDGITHQCHRIAVCFCCRARKPWGVNSDPERWFRNYSGKPTFSSRFLLACRGTVVGIFELMTRSEFEDMRIVPEREEPDAVATT